MKALALIAALAACGGTDTPQATPLASDGTHLRDDRGRIALLRGVNARVNGVFDVTFADGRAPLEAIPDLTDADCARMHALGLDFLRLPINWSAIEPTRGSYDDAYLDRVDDAVQCAARASVFVMIDLHEDAYSKEIGEDGAPLWAIQPPPTMLLGGPLDDLGNRRLSKQVGDAFATFFAAGDPSGLQDAYGAMLEHVAARWADDPAVVGFELFNEPVVDDELVAAFSQTAATRVAAVAPHKLVMFEPSAIRNLFDSTKLAKAPFAAPNAVYAPHVYTYVFASAPSPLDTLDPADLAGSVRSARDEATAWQTPLLIGEYGIGPTQPNADLWMGTEAELHDRYLASDAFWVWKEQSQGAWGVYDHDDTTDAWTERPQVVAWLSRVHAARIAGTVDENTYDHATRSLTLRVHGAGDTPHSIYAPAGGASATCDGDALQVLAGETFSDVRCDGTLVVSPN